MSSILDLTYERNQSDVTVIIRTDPWKYFYFHVPLQIANYCMKAYSKGAGNKVWHHLKPYDYGKRHMVTGKEETSWDPTKTPEKEE